ncbi:hypothetical protein CBW65_13845 [Tumebacillus avium]|uniref:HTH cro/C1-type domain-containing protein n=1 Tax=Tumebacillus avium TaxID=1903704 RepID=A0A1Y0IR91_9BACL|nr:helix-turn-helix transcriptional regulator [Tumebacillus avium]ARU61965.1 hypothetical protein CBW65_13845 [Tumebacillus avium]
MSSVEHLSTPIGNIPIGRRIAEIMSEKGNAFSIRAFSSRIGISKDMLGRMISGERYISPSELEVIAKGLSISVNRVKQKDTVNKSNELRSLLENEKNFKRALELALELQEVAIGCSERFVILNDLGRVYYATRKYEEAHVTWTRAIGFAQTIADEYHDTEPLYKVMNNLLLSFTEIKDYVGLNATISAVKHQFERFPTRMGTLYYSAAVVAFHAQNYDEAKVKFLDALRIFENTGKSIQIGTLEHNVGYTEYKLGNFSSAKEYFERAVTTLENFDEAKIIAVKDYVKTLLKTNEKKKARMLIDESLNDLEEKLDLPTRKAQFLMLRAIVDSDITSAESVLMVENAPSNLKYLVCKFLMNHYKEIGDAENLMRYYVIAEEHCVNNSAIYDEAGLSG